MAGYARLPHHPNELFSQLISGQTAIQNQIAVGLDLLLYSYVDSPGYIEIATKLLCYEAEQPLNAFYQLILICSISAKGFASAILRNLRATAMSSGAFLARRLLPESLVDIFDRVHQLLGLRDERRLSGRLPRQNVC